MAKRHSGPSSRGMQYLHGNYVYYASLRSTTFYPSLIAEVDPRFTQTVEASSNLDYISTFFLNAAAAELTKEQALIEEKFGHVLSGTYKDKDFAKKLIDAINTCMGIKEVFERNLALIIESNGQKNVMSWFPTYFQHAWERVSADVWEETINNFINNGYTQEDALKAAVDNKLNDIVRDALQEAFAAGVETGISTNREEYNNAYKSIAEALANNARGSNEFVEAFIRNYHLHEISDALKEYGEQSKIQNFLKGGNSGFNINANIHQRGGLTMEDFRTYIFNLIGEGINQANGPLHPRVSGITSGGTKQKADSIAAIDIPIDVIEQWIESNEFGDREKNIFAMKALRESLRNLTDGFVTMVNSKNYTLNENFEKGYGKHLGGFSAGEPISLENFAGAAAILDVNYSDLVHSCLQLIPGAIGEGQDDAVRTALTRAIASALFDDFDEIGVETTFPGATVIHLLDLNGVLLPASFYFQMLGEAFGQAASELKFRPEELIGVEITTPKNLLFDPYTPAPPGLSEAHWTAQAEQAMNNIKIKWTFLSGFKNIMAQVMG